MSNATENFGWSIRCGTRRDLMSGLPQGMRLDSWQETQKNGPPKRAKVGDPPTRVYWGVCVADSRKNYWRHRR